MMMVLIWLLNHHLPVCEAGFALVYASLAFLSRREPAHFAAYVAAALLAATLAVCAALV